MAHNNNDIAIIGSGITGLSAGYRLKKNGFKITVFEKNSEPGGAIKSVQQKGYLTEYGPNSILLKDRIIADFFQEVKLEDVMQEANPQSSKRYIVKNGVLTALPDSLLNAIKTPLFTFPGKMRILKEPFVSRSRDPDQTVAKFTERRLGREVLDYAINPFVAGIFANNPDTLSLRHAFPVMHDLEQEYGSLIVGMLFGSKSRREKGRIQRKLVSFDHGLQTLPKRLAAELNVLFGTRVTAIDKRGDGWVVEGTGKEHGPYGKLLLNVPLYQMNEIRLPFHEDFESISREVYYPPLSIVHLAFKKDFADHPLDGFGFLVPEKEKRGILGALFSSTLFQGRAPHDHHLMTVFIGGGRQPELANLKSEKIFDLVEGELRDLIGLKGEPAFKDHVYWPKSIPAYHVGYDDIEKQIEIIEKKSNGLYIIGNFRSGISVPDCIRNGLNVANSLMAEKSDQH